MNISNIKKLYDLIEKSVFTTTGTLDYDQVTDAIISLANAVHGYPGDNDDLWYMEGQYTCLADFIPGAYWHYSEWHAGQWSNGYEALSALGSVFSPGMSSLDDDSPETGTYVALNTMAEQETHKTA